jgi:two-component system chemotaxis response regulator CheB
VRRVLARTGVVLARDGGALPKMALPFRFGAGAILGSGRQWLPWIHIDDHAAALAFVIDHASVSGAVDFVAKPSTDLAGGLDAFGANLREKVRAAATSDVRAPGMKSPGAAKLRTAAAPNGALIAIGASTGGVEAIRIVLGDMPTDCPPIVIAQHMPAGFTTRFAARLDALSDVRVLEAEDRMPLEPGKAYVARGDWHLRVERSSGQLKCRLTQDELTSGHRPSVDVLFESVANVVGAMAVGTILTGMGRDGARGLKLMRNAGAYTVGQSQASALVYGMPRVAFEEGAVVEQAPVEAIAAKLAAALNRLKSAA